MTNNPSIHAAFTFVLQNRRRVSSIVALAFLFAFCALQPVIAQTVTTVSAASYDANALAPDGIASAFGTKLATQSVGAPSTPLPTTLGGTTVRVNSTLAQLFYVSPGQVNFLIPASIAPGTATIQITASDGTISNGTMQVKQTAPAIFTANSDGTGVPAAYLTRVLANGQQLPEPVEDIEAVTGRKIPRAINPGAATDRVFLILFVTGVRGADDPNKDGNLNENVHILMGGRELTPDYVGKHATFVGVDQINLELPRDLFGVGRMSFSVVVKNGAASNLPEIEMGATAGTNAPQILSFSANSVLAGQALTINGNNFAATPAGNLVRIGGVEARVTAASLSQLQIAVPFGAVSGPVTVRTAQGEGRSSNSLTVRTSLSGLVIDTSGQPLNGVAVRLSGTQINATTNSEGTFILPDVTAGSALVEVDATTIATPPFPKVTLSQKVTAGRDNPFGRSIALQQATGEAIPVSASSSLVAEASVSVRSITTEAATDVQFVIPPGAKATFPPGVTPGPLYVTIVENSRTPAPLPPSIFSSVIVQITPIGTTLTPGGKLIFPNTDKLTAGSQARLYKLDQKTGSPTIGTFIDIGAATVSADGMQIETATNAITEMTYYFVAIPSTSTTIVGRVTDSDKTTPVRNASVQVRGQSTTTDGNGAFIVREVPVRQGDQLTIDVSYTRPNGRVDRVLRSGINPVINGLTIVTPDLALPSEASNRPPVLVVPGAQTVTVGTKLSFSVTASDPDEGQLVVVTASGLPTGAVFSQGQFMWTPAANQVGSYTVSLTATDNGAPSLNTTKSVVIAVNTITYPVQLSVLENASIDAGRTLIFRVTITDMDVGKFYCLTTEHAGGINLGTPSRQSYCWIASSGQYTVQINLSPPVDKVGIATYKFTVTNDSSQPLSETKTATITVTLPIPTQSTWAQTSGPPGGNILCFASNSTTLFAGVAYGGVYRSTDGGLNWVAANNGLTNNGLDDLYVTSLLAQGSTLFAGTQLGKIFRSTDNGASWVFVFQASSPRGVATIESLQIKGTSLFAATSLGGVVRSTDNGLTWLAINAGLPSTIIAFSLAAIGETLFVGTQANGIYRSTDNGATWLSVNTGIPIGEGSIILSFTTNGSTLYAVGMEDYEKSAVFRSADFGVTWTRINNGLTGLVFSIILSGNTLFAATEYGVFNSTNNGASWVNVSNGLTSKSSHTLIFNGTNLLVGTFGGIYRSNNNGGNWTASSNGIIHSHVPKLLAKDGTLFAGTDDIGIMRSTDNGVTWVESNTGITGLSINSFAMNSSAIFVATNLTGGVFRSVDGGRTWGNSNDGLTNLFIRELKANGTTLFASTNKGVFRSINNGSTWTAINNGLANLNVYSTAVNGTTLFAGTNGGGIFRSTDNGASWTAVNNGLSYQNNIVSSFEVGENAIFAQIGGYVYRSTNSGLKWDIVLQSAQAIYLNGTMLLAYVNGGAGYFAGSGKTGVYSSVDNGTTWSSLDTASKINSDSGTSLVINGTTLFAGTVFNGVFRRPLP